MVILMHSPMPGVGTPGSVSTGISFVTAPCIGLFFMVSGALLLPIKVPMKEFYSRRLSKVVWPTVIWSLLYILVALVKGDIDVNVLPMMLCSIPFSAQGNGIMWFMYTLIGLYLISPLISPWLEKASKREIEFVLLLWIVTLLYPLISSYLIVDETPKGILNSFSGYAGYYLLGYYLRKYSPKANWTIQVLMIVVPVIICGITLVKGNEVDFYRQFWYLSVFVVVMAAGWFLLLKDLSSGKRAAALSSNGFLKTISNLCFGTYLIHIFIMRDVLWRIPLIERFGWGHQIIITFILTTILSFGLTWVLAQLPFGRFVVGYKY
jgi:surface polysaccharide O-acyltransferase-like enzyme